MTLRAERSKIEKVALEITKQVMSVPLARMDDVRRDWLAPPPPSAFKRLEPLSWIDDDDDWWVFHPDDCPPDLVWPLNTGYITAKLDIGMIRTVSAREARGYADRFAPLMVRVDAAMPDRGKLISGAGLYAWIGGRWIDAINRTQWTGRYAEVAIPHKWSDATDETNATVRMATAVALRQRYEWAVAVGLEDSLSVRFSTDPTGIGALFRLRDLPDGKDRREALMTWITDHWRQDRQDDDMELYVRKHLRGAINFNWRGLTCELLPAPFDVELRDKLIAQRNAMRVTGTDRRKRIRP
jgi:hypothetical protein